MALLLINLFLNSLDSFIILHYIYNNYNLIYIKNILYLIKMLVFQLINEKSK